MQCYRIPAVNLLGVSNSQYCFKIVSPFSHSCYCPCWISFYHYIGKAMTPPCKDPSRGGRYIAANGKSVSYAMYTISTVYACHKANSCDCMFPSIFPTVKTFFFSLGPKCSCTLCSGTCTCYDALRSPQAS